MIPPARKRFRAHPGHALALSLWLAVCAGLSAAPGRAQDRAAEPEAEAVEEDIEVMRVVPLETGSLPDDATAFGEWIDLSRFEGEAKRLEDVLAQSVGVQIRRFGGAGERAEISIRGFSAAQVRVELDSVSLNGGRSRGVDLASIPLSQLEAVEVIRGGSAGASGNGAMGGMVALRTRRPDFPSGGIDVHGGSFGTLQTALHATRPGKRVDLGFGYTGFRTEGDYEFQRLASEYPGGATLPPSTPSATRVNNDRQQHDGHLSLGFDFGERGYLLVQQLAGVQKGGEPGLDRETPSETAGQQRFAEHERLRSISQLRLESVRLPGPMGSLEASLSHRYDRSKFDDDDPALGEQAIDDRFDDHATRLALNPRWEVIGPFADHAVRVEAGFERQAFDATDTRARERYGAALAVRDDLSWFDERLILSPGLRFDWNDDDGSHWLPHLGLLVSPRPWLRLRANASRSFRSPSFEDLYLPDRGVTSGNPDLEPERARQYDVGIELLLNRVFFLRDVELSAAVFRAEIENSIIWLRVSPYKTRPENSDDAEVDGLELGLHFDLFPGARVFANHTELDAETEETGARLPGRAERETFVRLEWRLESLWKLTGEYQRTGKIPVSRSGRYVVPSREVWNAATAFDLASGLRRYGVDPGMQRLWLHAAVDNIGDVSIRDSLGFPQPGRTLWFGVEATW